MHNSLSRGSPGTTQGGTHGGQRAGRLCYYHYVCKTLHTGARTARTLLDQGPALRDTVARVALTEDNRATWQFSVPCEGHRWPRHYLKDTSWRNLSAAASHNSFSSGSCM